MAEKPVLRAHQIEAAVRAAMRAGLGQLRVVIDYRAGRVEIEGTADEPPPSPRSFDFVDFRAQ